MRTYGRLLCYVTFSVKNPDPEVPTLPKEDTVCFKCRRETVVKAVLPVGPVVYLRCEECGSAWSIAERRANPRSNSESAGADESADSGRSSRAAQPPADTGAGEGELPKTKKGSIN
jgi:hypothetical protein